MGPLVLELGEYALEEPGGRLVERGRAQDSVYVPLANTEGGLSISLTRGARAAEESGGFRAHVIQDRVTRASAFLFDSTADAVAFSRWVAEQVPAMREWLAGEPIEGLSKHAKLRELETHVVGPTCHVLYAYTTGDAVGMITRWMSCGRSAPVAPAVTRPKYGSVKIRFRNESSRGRIGSEITSATEFERRVTRLRAATFGTYPVSAIARCTAFRISGATDAAPLITRETVARETPAAAATSSMVGCCPPRAGREITAYV